MNIEKIKNKLDNGFYSNYSTYVHTDVANLLSIIEQAEKALERICTDPHTHRPARDFANQVLQAIRGSE